MKCLHETASSGLTNGSKLPFISLTASSDSTTLSSVLNYLQANVRTIVDFGIRSLIAQLTTKTFRCPLCLRYQCIFYVPF